MQTLYPIDIREEEIKLRVAKDFFTAYDTTRIIGSIDFCVAVPNADSLFKDEVESLVWGEAKQGTSHDIYHSFVQLILTIGKARTFDRNLPPQYLAAFDAARFAFIPYHAVQDVFYQNDFNWNVTPSDHQSKEFLQLYALVEKTLHENAFIYNYIDDEKALRRFIKQNLVLGNRKTRRHKVNKNNFTFVYQRWCEEVKQSIQIDWEKVKKAGLLDADFFLADLLSKDGNYLLDNLFVLLKHDHYQFDRRLDEFDLWGSKEARFKDNMQAHIAFWNKYERPPKREYWGYIVERRDLLVPQDVRERKGSFFTPRQWVELSQQYLADTLGEDWQENYYIWDCCAGTGNLLNGLTNPRRIWASTLDKADVDVMHERVRNGAKLFDNHIFQFDFLNDDFAKLPAELQDIINDPEKRKRLVIYINPPYAEAANAKTISGHGENKTDVAVTTQMYKKYLPIIGIAGRELFAQFFIRIYKEIPSCVLAEFSTLKILQAPNFADFRAAFRAELKKSFVVPSFTFDNVKGKFPIGFYVWNTAENTEFNSTITDVYDSKGDFVQKKKIGIEKTVKSINDWIITTRKRTNEIPIGYMSAKGNDFQNTNYIYIVNEKSQLPHPRGTIVTNKNLLEIAVYMSMRHCIPATWLNDRDQFLYPNDGWQTDRQFQLDCLVYTLFHGQNRISLGTRSSTPASKDIMRTGTSALQANHWLPFYENEIGITEGFASHFMQDFLRDFRAGKTGTHSSPSAVEQDLFSEQSKHSEMLATTAAIRQLTDCVPVEYSPEAAAVMQAGLEVYKYYHQMRKQKGGGNLNASLYDIKMYFKGRNDKGQMNATSDDERFNGLMERLRIALQALAKRIEPKVYEYGFLK